MATKAYFMVNVADGFSKERRVKAQRELEAMPEVQSVEWVSGTCDLLVTVEAPIRVIFVAHKIMAKEWVKRLRYAKIEELETTRHPKLAVWDLLKGLIKEHKLRHGTTAGVA